MSRKTMLNSTNIHNVESNAFISIPAVFSFVFIVILLSRTVLTSLIELDFNKTVVALLFLADTDPYFGRWKCWPRAPARGMHLDPCMGVVEALARIHRFAQREARPPRLRNSRSASVGAMA